MNQAFPSEESMPGTPFPSAIDPWAFLKRLGHDLRSPLAGIHGFAHEALYGLKECEEKLNTPGFANNSLFLNIHEDLGRVVKNTERLDLLLGMIQKWSRLGLADAPPLSRVSLQESLTKALHRFQGDFAVLELDRSPNDPNYCLGHSETLSRLWLELLGLLSAMTGVEGRSLPRVFCKVGSTQGGVRVTVSTQGLPNLPPPMVLMDAMRSEPGWSGLNLAQIACLAGQMSGGASLELTPGEGLCVHFKFLDPSNT